MKAQKFIIIFSLLLSTALFAKPPAGLFNWFSRFCRAVIETVASNKGSANNKIDLSQAAIRSKLIAISKRYPQLFHLAEEASLGRLFSTTLEKLSPSDMQPQTYRSQTVNGSRIITRFEKPLSYQNSVQLEEALVRLEKWYKQGSGLPIEKIVLYETNKGLNIAIVMPDFKQHGSQGSVLNAANAYQAAYLQSLPIDTRRWVRRKMLAMLESHPDPHLGNVMFRVTKLSPGTRPTLNKFSRLEGNLLIELINVDPFPARFVVDNLRDAPPQGYQTDIYSRRWQREQLNIMLGL